MLLSLHHLCEDLYRGSPRTDVSCCRDETECNSQSPHLEQGGSPGHILTFTPDCPQINSIYVGGDPPAGPVTFIFSAWLVLSCFRDVNHGELSYKGIPCYSVCELCWSYAVAQVYQRCVRRFLCVASAQVWCIWLSDGSWLCFHVIVSLIFLTLRFFISGFNK